MTRSWAFWRRVQYIAVAGVLILGIGAGIYYAFIYTSPTCSDGRQNGGERGIDCGGFCSRVCALDAIPPSVQWTDAFRVTERLYNAVAYVENRNLDVGTPELRYTFSLYDAGGSLITTRSGTTFLPPDSVYPIFEGRIDVGASVPERTSIEIQPIDNWRKATAGREQFEVQSRELIGADDKPRLNTAIFNTLIQDERDVEVIATIFDVRGNALAASRSVVPLFEAREVQNIVFTWPEPIAKTLRSCETPSDVILAIDLSGSMNDDGGVPPEPITSVLTAARSFVERLQTGDKAGLVTFASAARTTHSLSTDLSEVGGAIESLSISPSEEAGSTNIGDAIANVRDEFASERHNQNARKVLVLLTDGRANAPGENAEEYALGEARSAQTEGVIIYTVGLGNNVNHTFLTGVSEDPGRMYSALTTRDLERIYSSISTAICEEGPAIIDVVVKTPGSLIVE